MLRQVFVQFTLLSEGLSKISLIIGIKLRAILLKILIIVTDLLLLSLF